MSAWILTQGELQRLLELLQEDGRALIGPTLGEGAIVYDRIRGLADLPRGVRDQQAPGRYRLGRRDDDALFAYVVGPGSWKRFLFPPEVRLWQARREDGRLQLTPEPLPSPKYAFLGVRPCELAAIGIQDRVFLEGAQVDPVYQDRRADVLTVVVQCGVPAETCFCTSMGGGPRAHTGFDLALTELLEPAPPRYLLQAGSPRGQALAGRLGAQEAEAEDQAAAGRVTAAAVDAIQRRLETERLPEALHALPEHPRWAQVAARCLSCGNCTLVCPTCFCSDVEDTSDLTGEHAERWRRWDTCFSLDHSYLHGGSVRASTRSRYRQWLTHKLSTWHDQFGSSGCVGCGRCLTWCPVGIDITEEATALREAYLETEGDGGDDR